MRIPFILTALNLIAAHSLADTVWLTNGDRISGDIVELSNASLKIKTGYAGTIALDTNVIQSFHTDAKQHWQINLKPRSVLINQSDRHGHVNIDGKNIAIHDLKLTPPQAHWKKSGLLETTLDVDNDEQRKEKLHINSELNLESKHWRHELKGEVKRDQENHKISEDTEEFNYTLDYLFSEHWLLRTDSTYREEGSTITNRYMYLGTGPGYRLWGENEDKLDIILSYNHIWLHSSTIDMDLDAWGTKLDYTQFWFDKKLETFADIQISHLYLSNLNYIANTSAGLRFYFTHHIHLSFKYDYNETQFSFGSIKDSSYVLGAGANF
jgi:ribosome recycling factor